MPTQTVIEQLIELLSRTGNAHGEYEETELNGVYDQNWPEWYAAYAVQHGLNEIVTPKVTAEQLSLFLAKSFEAFKQDNLGMGWEEYTTRKLVETLGQEP